MADTRYEDLFDAAAVVDTEQLLKGRLDPALDSIVSTAAEPKRITGFMGRCANTGYLILRRSGKTISTIDLAIMNALTEFSPLDIPLEPGQKLSVSEMSTSGTALCSCTIRYEVG